MAAVKKGLTVLSEGRNCERERSRNTQRLEYKTGDRDPICLIGRHIYCA
jgi:hypothetical protein